MRAGAWALATMLVNVVQYVRGSLWQLESLRLLRVIILDARNLLLVTAAGPSLPLHEALLSVLVLYHVHVKRRTSEDGYCNA